MPKPARNDQWFLLPSKWQTRCCCSYYMLMYYYLLTTKPLLLYLCTTYSDKHYGTTYTMMSVKVISIRICITISQSIAYSPHHCSSQDVPLLVVLTSPVSEQFFSLHNTKWPLEPVVVEMNRIGLGERFRDTRRESEREGAILVLVWADSSFSFIMG